MPQQGVKETVEHLHEHAGNTGVCHFCGRNIKCDPEMTTETRTRYSAVLQDNVMLHNEVPHNTSVLHNKVPHNTSVLRNEVTHYNVMLHNAGPNNPVTLHSKYSVIP